MVGGRHFNLINGFHKPIYKKNIGYVGMSDIGEMCFFVMFIGTW